VNLRFHPLINVFRRFEFGNEECQHPRGIRIREIVVIVNICSVPEIRVQADDFKAFGCDIGVRAVMRGCILRCRPIDPSERIPQSR
jgi:hypothetical protein